MTSDNSSKTDSLLPLILVTGAAGFTGGHLVRHLVSTGRYTVRALVRDRVRARALEGPGVDVVEGDLTDASSLERACEGVSGVMHIAAIYRQAGIPDSAYTEVNVEGTRRLFQAAIGARVSRIIHCSTVGVHGDVKNPPASEEAPFAPGDIYQRTKLEGERVALEFYRSGAIGGLVIRPAIIYGPGDERTGKIFSMVARKVFFYVGRGEKHLHFVDVRDLVRAFELAFDHSELNGEVFIIPGERAMPLRTMVEIIADELKVPRPWLSLPVRPVQFLGSVCEAVCAPLGINPPIYRRRVDFYTKNRHFDGSKAHRLLGYTPAKRSEDEVREISQWYRAQGWY